MEVGCPAAPSIPLAEPARVQEVPSGLGEALRTIGKDFAAFPSAKTFTWMGAGAGMALIGTTGDRALVRNLDGKRWSVFRAGADMGSAKAHAGLALGTFLAGRLAGSKEVSALGFQLIRANLMTQAFTHGIKFTTHRIRPDGTGLSFPSGHSATSFAAATVVQRRYGWKAGVPAYALASYVAASRVNDRRHFASDVIFGAGLGIAVGLTVTRDLPGGGSFVPVVTKGGAAAVWTKTW
jgi:membrane-associated phospholipid phosphatase